MEINNYERIGSKLCQRYKNLDIAENHPDKKRLWNFIQAYEELPLFLVGFNKTDIEGIRNNACTEDEIKELMLTELTNSNSQ
jgi:hypothetical protein